MSTTDRERLDLYRKLEATLGSKEADTLMAHLPPVTWQHVATKDDLESTRLLLRSDIREYSTELRSEMQVLRHELRSEMHQGFTRTIMWLVGAMVSWSAVTIAAVGIMI